MAERLIVWGRATSSNVQAVMWTVGELGLDHERHDVGGAFGGTDTPSFRDMNPMGLVPVLHDGELVMFESAAIVRYLAAHYGNKKMWPRNPAKRASLDVIAEWSKTTVAKALIYDVFWQLIRTPAAERDMAIVDRGARELTNYMAIAQEWLGAKPYFGGDAPCFADIMFGHLLYRYYTLDFERSQTPVLDDYYARLTERPAYREHVMVDYSSLKAD